MKKTTRIISFIVVLTAQNVFTMQKPHPKALCQAIDEIHEDWKKFEQEKENEKRKACNECVNLHTSQSKWVQQYRHKVCSDVEFFQYTSPAPLFSTQDCQLYVRTAIDLSKFKRPQFKNALVAAVIAPHYFHKAEEKKEFPFHLNSCQ